MKSVLLSIKPEGCELIAARKKLLEIRKNRPKIDVPFKVYMQCTKSEPTILKRSFVGKGKPLFDIIPKNDVDCYNQSYVWNGKVIGEFVCDDIEMWNEEECLEINPATGHSYLCEMSCVPWRELKQYWGDSEDIYTWHISDLVIYDKPKELSEFGLTRPPQSWRYVANNT